MGLPLHFIRNLSTGAWVGAPVEGLEEGDFDDAYPFTSLGQALGVTEHLRRQAKRVGRRVIGFLTRRDPDQYDVVTLTLGDPNDQLGDYQGEIGEAPDDEDGECRGRTGRRRRVRRPRRPRPGPGPPAVALQPLAAPVDPQAREGGRLMVASFTLGWAALCGLLTLVLWLGLVFWPMPAPTGFLDINGSIIAFLRLVGGVTGGLVIWLIYFALLVH